MHHVLGSLGSGCRSEMKIAASGAASRLHRWKERRVCEIEVNVDRHRAADRGVDIADLAGALRLEVAGEDEITAYREGGEQYPVKTRVREDQRRDIQAIGTADGPIAQRP